MVGTEAMITVWGYGSRNGSRAKLIDTDQFLSALLPVEIKLLELLVPVNSPFPSLSLLLSPHKCRSCGRCLQASWV